MATLPRPLGSRPKLLPLAAIPFAVALAVYFSRSHPQPTQPKVAAQLLTTPPDQTAPIATATTLAPAAPAFAPHKTPLFTLTAPWLDLTSLDDADDAPAESAILTDDTVQSATETLADLSVTPTTEDAPSLCGPLTSATLQGALANLTLPPISNLPHSSASAGGGADSSGGAAAPHPHHLLTKFPLPATPTDVTLSISADPVTVAGDQSAPAAGTPVPTPTALTAALPLLAFLLRLKPPQ